MKNTTKENLITRFNNLQAASIFIKETVSENFDLFRFVEEFDDRNFFDKTFYDSIIEDDLKEDESFGDILDAFLECNLEEERQDRLLNEYENKLYKIIIELHSYISEDEECWDILQNIENNFLGWGYNARV